MSDAQTIVKAQNSPRQKRPKTGGRAPKVTQERVIQVASLIAIGMPELYACAKAKVNYAGFKTACERNGAYREIVIAKQAEFMEVAVKDIADSKCSNVRQRGLMWLLERRHREHYGPKGLEITNNVNVFGSEGESEIQGLAHSQFIPAIKHQNRTTN
jgi:hypothetical protein